MKRSTRLILSIIVFTMGFCAGSSVGLVGTFIGFPVASNGGVLCGFVCTYFFNNLTGR